MATAPTAVQPVQSPPPFIPQPVYVPPPGEYHIYNCHQLESLWIREGGNPDAAFIAAEIATAESGGRAWIVSPTDDWGLWQINASHNPSDPDIYLDPVVNVRTAIAISADGTNWTAWTTWVKGIYIGLCLHALSRSVLPPASRVHVHLYRAV